MTKVILDGLWCGQGMANMVRIFKDSNADPNTQPADGLCIFDFGSGGLSKIKKALGITPPVKFMIEQLELQQKANRVPTVDLMLISHQDRDHWHLLRELHDQIVARKMDIKIGFLVLAGRNWRDSSAAAVEKFQGYATKFCCYDNQFSSYNTPGHVDVECVIHDMVVTTLVTNVPTNDKSEEIERNCSSAVVLLELDGLCFILPGDATWETFAAFKGVMNDWTFNPIDLVYAASVPHHGSLITMSCAALKNNPLYYLDWFTDYTRPNSIYASAGVTEKYKHPYKIILERMAAKAGRDQFQARPVVAFNGPANQFEIEQKVTQNKYTTVLNLDPDVPAETANWIFTIDPPLHSTNIQKFEAGVPAILSAPELNEMELLAQLHTEKIDFDMDWQMGVTDFRLSRGAISADAATFDGGAPASAGVPPRMLPEAAGEQLRPMVHRPLPTAGAARTAQRRPPPRCRVLAVAAAA